MKIYNYSESGEYVCESTAGVSPLDGLPLIPRNATTIAPPGPQNKKARIFGDNTWSLVDDFRGETRYKKGTRESVTIDFLGPIDDNLFQLGPEPYTAEEKWKIIRQQRDSLLAGSDWTQTLDSKVNKEEWAYYRQQLRDIPQNYSNPDDVIWPLKPGG